MSSPPDGSATSDYDFDLPPDRIAQRPAAKRDESRLMIVRRHSGTIEHAKFSDLPTLIPPGDAIVLNLSRYDRKFNRVAQRIVQFTYQ